MNREDLKEVVRVAHPVTLKTQAALLRHAHMIWRSSQEGVSEELERLDVESRYQAAV